MALTQDDLALEKGLMRDHPVFYNALRHHKTHRGEHLDFTLNPWVLDVYLDNHPFQAHIKSTQNGITEYLLCRELTEATMGRNIFHVMPDGNLMGRYVHERVDKTIELVQVYKRHLKRDSVTLKQLGKGTIAYVWSGSPGQFTEFAADTIIIDEVDRCDQDNLVMAKERLSNSRDPRQIWVSNPTIEGFGIDAMFAETDQQHWHIKCECGAVTHPDFFLHVVREVEKGSFMVIDPDWEPGKDASMVCDKCSRKWAKSQGGVWIPRNPGSLKRGRHFSKLFTARTKISELIENFIAAESDDTKMTRFFNADLGKAYTAPGAKITEEMLDECLTTFRQGVVPKYGVCVVGIDVGSFFNVSVGWLEFDKPGVQLIDAKAVRTPEEVIDLLKKYKARCFVIDAMPETRTSKRIMAAHAGGFMCYFSKGKKDNINGQQITTDRTQALDNVKAAVTTKALRLPTNARSIPDFYAQMCASTRVFDENGNGGEGAYNWIEGSKADHYFLSTAYMFMAGRILMMASR